MTVSESTRKERRKYFNSHPHEEDDIRFRNIWRTASAFQLTSSRRGWHEGDTESLKVMAFQLTSSRRGWLFFRAQRIWKGYFNSHPHEEDDRISDIVLSPNISFQLTSSRRGWLFFQLFHLIILLFQLTSSRRGWRRKSKTVRKQTNFNSHPHEEDDSVRKIPYIVEIISTHILTKRMT